jgi:hypothetical protein
MGQPGVAARSVRVALILELEVEHTECVRSNTSYINWLTTTGRLQRTRGPRREALAAGVLVQIDRYFDVRGQPTRELALRGTNGISVARSSRRARSTVAGQF